MSLLLALFTTLLPLPLPSTPAPAPPHEYHVSKTNIRYVAEREQVQVEMHLFVDDLEAALREAGAPELNLGTEEENKYSVKFLSNYLDKHFSIKWNGERLPVSIQGWEMEDDLHGFWIYLAADTAVDPREVSIHNSVLTGRYADQKNIVKLFKGQARAGTLLLGRDRPAGAVRL